MEAPAPMPLLQGGKLRMQKRNDTKLQPAPNVGHRLSRRRHTRLNLCQSGGPGILASTAPFTTPRFQQNDALLLLQRCSKTFGAHEK